MRSENGEPAAMTDPDLDVLQDETTRRPSTRTDAEPPRHPHTRWRLVGVVALGGAVGTAARDLLTLALPAAGTVSWTIFGINVLGAFLLGLLLESLALRGPDEGRRRTLRLLLGTGVLGGFTTYSTLAESTAALALDGQVGGAAVYAVLTVVAGAVATALGLVIASASRRRPTPDRHGATA